MASSEDFQKVFNLYQKTGVPKGISIVSFCQQSSIIYSQFERWYKSRTKGTSEIGQVRIVNQDGLSDVSSDSLGCTSTDSTSDQNASRLRFNLSVRTTEGSSVQQNNLTYHQLLMLVEKLKVIC